MYMNTFYTDVLDIAQVYQLLLLMVSMILVNMNTVFGKFDHASIVFYCQSKWKGYFGCGMVLWTFKVLAYVGHRTFEVDDHRGIISYVSNG